jgi:hypothetical protein
MVQMGMQRIVIESGRLNASMRFHIDTSSVAENDKGSQFDVRNTSHGSIGAKFGPWGAEAKVQNTIGYVTTDRTSTSEEINTSLDLDSGVELIFRTDYVPLDRLATGADANRIRVNTINPQAEADRTAREGEARTAARTAERKARAERLDRALPPPPPPPPSGTGSAGASGGAGGPGATSAPSEDKRARDRAKEAGLGRGAKRNADEHLVEGQTITNWKQALAQLALVYTARINPHPYRKPAAFHKDLTSSGRRRRRPMAERPPAWRSPKRRAPV